MLFEATGLPTLKKAGSSFRSHQRPMPIGNSPWTFMLICFRSLITCKSIGDGVIGDWVIVIA